MLIFGYRRSYNTPSSYKSYNTTRYCRFIHNQGCQFLWIMSIQCLNLHVVHQNHNPFLHRYIITNRAREVAYFAHIWMVAFPFFSSTPSFNTDDARVLTTRSSALSKLFTKGKSIRSCKSKNFLRGWVGWNGKWLNQ